MWGGGDARVRTLRHRVGRGAVPFAWPSHAGRTFHAHLLLGLARDVEEAGKRVRFLWSGNSGGGGGGAWIHVSTARSFTGRGTTCAVSRICSFPNSGDKTAQFECAYTRVHRCNTPPRPPAPRPPRAMRAAVFTVSPKTRYLGFR